VSLSDLAKYPLTRTSRGLSATAELLVVYVFVLSLGYSSMLLLVVSHLGHIVSDDCDDKADIVNRRSVLCGQVNNVLRCLGKGGEGRDVEMG